MLRVSLGLHLGSALLLAAGSWLFGQELGYAFAGLFLLSTLFRPAAEYHRFLHDKLSRFLGEVKVPREDAVKLLHDLRALGEAMGAQRRGLEDHGKELQQLQHGLHHLGEAARAGDLENQRRLDAVARKFEETIDRLTDNQEIISGIKAFLRLVQPARQS
jgi:hypothetical protein